MKDERDGVTRREALTLLGVGVPALGGLQVAVPRRAGAAKVPPRWHKPAVPVAGKLLGLSDLTFKGMWGFPRTNLANNDFPYAYGPVALRYVNGERRILISGWGRKRTGQGWDVQDLFELSTPNTYAASASNSGVSATLALTGRRWPAAAWQNIGVQETVNGIVIGCGWWDEPQQVLWYTTFAYYSASPCAVLHAVRLHDDGTCTRYGPWHYGDPLSTDWKRVCMWLTPIPDAYQAALKDRTHLMGGTVMSIGGQANWGLGLMAVNLPTLKPAISGRAEAYNTEPGTRFFIRTDHDLSGVPVDGTAVFFFAQPSAAARSSWQHYTVPKAIRRVGGALWEIDGSVANTAVVGAHASGVDWAVTYVMPDRGLPLADFSPEGSGLKWPDYFQRRSADYSNLQAKYDLRTDPSFGGRAGEYSVVSSERPRAVPDATSIQLAMTASAAVGDFLGWRTNVPDGLVLQVRKIKAWDERSKIATVDAPWSMTPPLEIPCDVRRHNRIVPGDWQGVSAAIPDSRGGDGYWQSSLDAAISCVWVERAGKHAVLLFGRQAFGGIWYHYWDTYAHFGAVDRARSNAYFGSSYGYHAERYRSTLFLYDPKDLVDAAAGRRPPNAHGMHYVDGGDWMAACPAVPLYRESALFPGHSSIHHNPSNGGAQMALVDTHTNELILILRERLAHMEPLAVVFGF